MNMYGLTPFRGVAAKHGEKRVDVLVRDFAGQETFQRQHELPLALPALFGGPTADAVVCRLESLGYGAGACGTRDALRAFRASFSLISRNTLRAPARKCSSIVFLCKKTSSARFEPGKAFRTSSKLVLGPRIISRLLPSALQLFLDNRQELPLVSKSIMAIPAGRKLFFGYCLRVGTPHALVRKGQEPHRGVATIPLHRGKIRLLGRDVLPGEKPQRPDTPDVQRGLQIASSRRTMTRRPSPFRLCGIESRIFSCFIWDLATHRIEQQRYLMLPGKNETERPEVARWTPGFAQRERRKERNKMMQRARERSGKIEGGRHFFRMVFLRAAEQASTAA